MFKNCKCGRVMRMELRKLIFSRRVFIYHVPVYACQDCSTYELIPILKQDIICYLSSLGDVKSQLKVSFADIYEPASVLRDALSSSSDSPLEFQLRCKTAFDDRINMLLDLYQVAKLETDSIWMAEITTRLEKMTAFAKLQKEYLDFCAS